MSWAIWITGPPGSGKSTLARLAAERLAKAGEPVTVLELDRLRAVLTPHATYSDAEREMVYHALVFMAISLTDNGRPVLIDATAHRRAWRDLARASIERFAEVQLECPLETCITRAETRRGGFAPRHLYDAAGHPGATVPGVDVAYEPALAPELLIDSAVVPPDRAADHIVTLALTLAMAGPRRPHSGTGAVLWLTGLPGSGKTTLASRLADALGAEKVPVAVVEWAALRAMALPHACATPAELDIAHRALACAAAELAATGTTVIVDATAPRRAWRETARMLVETFAEVQLVCAPGTCIDRERAVRWRPRPWAQGGGVLAPESAPEYEYATNPELIIDTEHRSEWAAVEALLSLSRRLLARRRPQERPPCE